MKNLEEFHVEAGSFEELKIELEPMFECIAKKENILENITRLTQLQQEIGLSAPSQLRHYLEKRSYKKALDFLLQGYATEDNNQPDCDRVK